MIHLGEINWTTIIGIVLGGLITGVLGTLIKNRPAMQKIDNEREENLLKERAADMASMRSEIKEIRAAQERQAKEHREALAKQAEEHRAAMEAKEALHVAQRRADTHRINNVSQCLDALLLMIEQSPEKASEAAGRVREMRAKQQVRENEERATIQAAAINAGHTLSQGVNP